MASGDDQREQREGRGGVIPIVTRRAQPVGIQMPGDVVDRDQRQAARPGRGLGRIDPNQQRTAQAWALRHGDRVEIIPAQTGRLERGPHHRSQIAQVLAAGDLGHHAAVAGMDPSL